MPCAFIAQDLLADRSVEDGVHVVFGAEEERQRRHDRLGHDVVQDRRVDAHHVEPADLELLERVALVAQGAVGVDLHAQPAVALLAELLAHVLDRQHGRIVAGMDVRRPEVARLRWCRERQANCEKRNAGEIQDHVGMPS